MMLQLLEVCNDEYINHMKQEFCDTSVSNADSGQSFYNSI